MSAIQFTTDNLIALKKLEVAVRREDGLRFILSEESSLLRLIECAFRSTCPSVQTALSKFILGLSQETQEKLIYRGATFSGDRQAETAGSKATSGQKGRVFRGVKIAASNTESSEQARSLGPKTKVYRGSVVQV